MEMKSYNLHEMVNINTPILEDIAGQLKENLKKQNGM